MINFRKRIKELCSQKGITQRDLAARMGITAISLNKTLRGEYPQLQTIERIALALNIDISEIFEKPRTPFFTCPNCGAELEIRKFGK